jgi:hypothetical protein
MKATKTQTTVANYYTSNSRYKPPEQQSQYPTRSVKNMLPPTVLCFTVPLQILKIHLLSSLCFTVPLAQKYIFSSFLCLTVPPTKNTSTLPKGASLSHQPQIHSLSFTWLTVPLAKNISSPLNVSHCPTSQKFIHPPFCASLSH